MSPARLDPQESEFHRRTRHLDWATLGLISWPYVQHRGSSKEFLKVIDKRSIAFADFRGNKHCISTDKLITDNRVGSIRVDYPRQLRLKILGRV